MAIGLGDLLLVAVYPCLWPPGGASGLLIALGVVGGLLALPQASTIPVMAVLGPPDGAPVLWWIHRREAERTTWQYLQAEPRECSAKGRRRASLSEPAR